MALTPHEAASAAAGIVDRLRAGSDARSPARDQAVAEVDEYDGDIDQLGSSLEFLVLADARFNTGQSASQAAMCRAAAITLSGARHSFLAGAHHDDATLTAAMPFIAHVSKLAESLVRLSDWLTVESHEPPSTRP